MIGRKKKRELEKEEAEDDSYLHKNKSLLEYQNKCLCTMIDNLKNNLKEKENEFNKLNKNFDFLLKYFVNFTNNLNLLNKSLINFLEENNINLEKNEISDNKSSVEIIISNLIKNNNIIINNSNNINDNNNKNNIDNNDNNNINDNNNNDCNEIIELKNLKNSFEILTKNLLSLLKNKNNNLNENLEKKISLEIENNNQLKANYDLLNSQNLLNQTKISELSKQIENLKSENFKLTRKINATPLVPYIILEKDFFNKKIEEHNCVCLICGKQLEINNNNMDVEENKNNNNNNNNDEITELLTKENESLKNRIKELYTNIESLKTITDFSEENILHSKRFQTLISQAENILIKLDSLKDSYKELQIINQTLTNEKNFEIEKLTKNFEDKISSYKNIIEEANKELETSKNNIKILNNKIEELQNIIKAKESIDIHSLYDLFTNERKEIIKQIKIINNIKKDYINKYNEEKEKNFNNEINIKKLTNEINDLHNNNNNINININNNNNNININNTNINNNNNNGNKEKKTITYIETSSQNENYLIKRKNDEIEILKKENEKTKNELSKERNNSDNLIEMITQNEKGINDLNLVIKNLKTELQNAKEVQAKMTNDVLRLNNIVSSQDESKKILENLNTILKEKIENYEIFTKKLEIEINEKNNIIKIYEDNKKINEKEIDTLKKNMIEKLKLIDSEKILKEDAQNQFNQMKNNYVKALADYDALKIKYDELCKYKKFDNILFNYEDMQKENQILKMENNSYRELIHCKVCKTNRKNVVITKCFHTFCRGCVEATFESRKRKCPICRESISQNDVKEIFWD